MCCRLFVWRIDLISDIFSHFAPFSLNNTADTETLLHLCFLRQLWSATTSQPVTRWPKCFREYQEVRCILYSLFHLRLKPDNNTCAWLSYSLCCSVSAVGPDHILAERHFVILLTTVAFTLPLSLYRNIERLGKVSLITTRLSVSFSGFKAACKTSVCVTRCPSCQWCWHSPSSSL